MYMGQLSFWLKVVTTTSSLSDVYLFSIIQLLGPFSGQINVYHDFSEHICLDVYPLRQKHQPSENNKLRKNERVMNLIFNGYWNIQNCTKRGKI